MEIMGTHLCFAIGAWRLRFSLAIEDTDVQLQTQQTRAETPLRLPSSEKLTRIFPNRR